MATKPCLSAVAGEDKEGRSCNVTFTLHDGLALERNGIIIEYCNFKAAALFCFAFCSLECLCVDGIKRSRPREEAECIFKENFDCRIELM
eukprot:TRINITY_DN2214_c0_g1_i1.p2 TRINITY_DN2214_c0_g1~~TRINITY_DN2214_c0_g1_i1.p2  ORF type:complete len:102 (+),score=10.41 TRINITY_DN2214_c0_g1_i1:37-306(+)